MSKDCSDYSDGYDKGFAEGLKTADFSDAYWLRAFAGQAMQGLLAYQGFVADKDVFMKAPLAYAKALLAEVKKCEANND